MKTPILIVSTLLSLPAFAGTFEDREKAMLENQKSQFAHQLEHENLARNQLFLAKLRHVIEAHRGLKAPLDCKTERAENIVANDPAKDAIYELVGSGLRVPVQYVPGEQNASLIVSGIGPSGFGGWTRQPEPESCSLELRDGQACEVSIASDENGAANSAFVQATCISASLKKTVENLGKITR